MAMNWEFLKQYSDYAVPAAIAVGVLLVLWLLIRMIGRKVSSGRRGSRLAVAEYHEIDSSRRLVLLRRDNVEHLVMIGGNQDLVIESGIGARKHDVLSGLSDPTPSLEVRPRRDTSDEAEETDRIQPSLTRPPKPAVFGDRAPNLRPVPPREEPKLESAETDTKSS